MNNNYYNKGNNYPGAVPPPLNNEQRSGVVYTDIATVMRGVYGKMSLGLFVTAITSWLLLSSESMVSAIFGNMFVFFGLAVVELGLVFYLSARIEKLNPGTATALFYLYSVLNGVTLTPIFFVYTLSSIASTFFITAGTFGAMTIFGYVTKQDLSKIGSILFMALIGLIICSIVNIFLKSSGLEWIISLAGVVIFVGLTAWDTQKIKRMAETTYGDDASRLSTLGALSLYLDFVNLFIYLLRIFGRTNESNHKKRQYYEGATTHSRDQNSGAACLGTRTVAHRRGRSVHQHLAALLPRGEPIAHIPHQRNQEH